MDAREALKQLIEAGKNSFTTCESGNGYKVVSKFKTLEEAHRYYEALINATKVYEELLEEDRLAQESYSEWCKENGQWP